MYLSRTKVAQVFYSNMLLWIIIVLLLSLTLYLKCLKPLYYWKYAGVPYINPWTVLKGTISLICCQTNVIDLDQKIYNAVVAFKTRYIGSNVMMRPILIIRDLNLIKRVAVKDFEHFVDHGIFITEDMDPLVGKNLFSLREEKWKYIRSVLSPAFTGSKMRSMFVLMSECAEVFTNYLTENVNTNEPLTVELKDLYTRFANDVIASTAFGIKCDSLKEKDNEFYVMGQQIVSFGVIRVLKFFGYLLCTPVMKFFKVRLYSDKLCNFFSNIILSNIETRKKEGIMRPDMIHLLMEAQKGQLKHDENVKHDESAGFATVEESSIGKQNVQSKSVLSNEEVVAQTIVFFMAGFETVSTVLCHLTYELAINEEIQTKLQEEIDNMLLECDRKMTYDNVLKMKYLDMVVSETLRKWPPVPTLDRSCLDSYTIPAELPGEVPVKFTKGQSASFLVYGLQRDPEHFPNPDKFDPERFSDENKKNIKPFSYMPFGVGPRNCIGSRFALLEIKTVMIRLLAKFNIVLTGKSQVPLQLTKTKFTMDADNGFWVGIKRRNCI